MVNVCLIHKDARTTTAQAETRGQAHAWALHIADDPFYTRNGTNPILRIFIGGDGALAEETTPEALRVAMTRGTRTGANA